MREQGYVIGAGVQIYICIYIGMFVDKKKLNRTLAIDSPFQTCVVGLLVVNYYFYDEKADSCWGILHICVQYTNFASPCGLGFTPYTAYTCVRYLP